MPNPFGLPEATRPVLSKYEFKVNPSDFGGIAYFHWSDDSVDKVPVTSEEVALGMLIKIQHEGGFKPIQDTNDPT